LTSVVEFLKVCYSVLCISNITEINFPTRLKKAFDRYNHRSFKTPFVIIPNIYR